MTKCDLPIVLAFPHFIDWEIGRYKKIWTSFCFKKMNRGLSDKL